MSTTLAPARANSSTRPPSPAPPSSGVGSPTARCPGAEAIAVVDRAVARSGAEVLYTHAPNDSHQDHIATSSICLAAARRVPTVLYYETPSTLEFMPTVFTDLDDVMERKIALVPAHLSQVLRNGPVDLDAVVAQARFRGSQSRTQHAEAFRPARFLWDLLSAPEHAPRTHVRAGTSSHRPRDRAPSDQRGRRLAEPMNAAPGSPWTLLGMAGIFLIAVGLFGADVVCLTIVSGLAVLFIVFLLRHMASRARRCRPRPATCAARILRLRVPAARQCPRAVPQRGAGARRPRQVPPHVRLPARPPRDHGGERRVRRRDRVHPRRARPPRLACGPSTAPRALPAEVGRIEPRAVEDATGDVIVVFDADHKPRADVLRRLVRHFADPRTAAVQGRCIVRNSNESKLAQTIAVDYYCGYLVNEYGRQSLYDLPAYEGANSRCGPARSARSAAGTRRPSPKTPTSPCGWCSRACACGTT